MTSDSASPTLLAGPAENRTKIRNFVDMSGMMKQANTVQTGGDTRAS